MNIKAQKYSKGFSLVEIVVASVLLALIAAGIFSVTLSSRKIINRSSKRYYANKVAVAVLENLRQYLGADNWYSSSSPISIGDKGPYYFNDYSNSNLLVRTISNIFGNTEFANKYKGKWRYEVENPSGYDYRKVMVEVNWTEPEL